MAEGLAIKALLAVAVVGTVGDVVEGRKARKEQEKASDLQTATGQAEAGRQRRKKVREARIRRSTLEARAQSTGTEGSSSVAGAGASLSSQLAEQLSTLNFNKRATSSLNKISGNISQARGRQSVFGAVAGLSLQAASVFDKPKEP